MKVKRLYRDTEILLAKQKSPARIAANNEAWK